MATITKIKNSKKGSYRITVSNGYDANNKQIRITKTFTPDKTKTERQQQKQVQEYALEFERQVKTGKLYEGDKIIFSEFVKRWEEDEAKQRLEATTLYSYKGYLKNVIIPAIGKYKMVAITPIVLEKFYNSLTMDNAKIRGEGRYKIASIRKFHKIISGIMRTAVRWGVIEVNPCEKAKLPKDNENNIDVKYFTLEQAKRFLEAMEHPYKVPFNGHTIKIPSGKITFMDGYVKERMLPSQFKIFYRLCLFAGLRKGEALALTWEDVDVKKNTISITKSLGHTQNGQETKTTKTIRSNRILPIPKSEIDLLQKWKIEQKNFMFSVGSKWEGYRGNDFDKNSIFIQMNSNYGKTMNIATPYRKFETFIKYYNQTVEKEERLPVIPLHGLRHTCATLNVSLGTDLKTLQATLGHANIQTTLNIYAHALEEKKREASKALDNLLNKEA